MTPLEISGSLNVLGYGLATLGPGIGVALIFYAGINGIARQPEARGTIMQPVYIGFVLAFVIR